MKAKSLFILTVVVAMVFWGCEEHAYINAPSVDNPQIPDSIPELVGPEPTPDPEGADIPEGCLNVYEALKVCKKLAPGAVTSDSLYVKGWIYELDASKHQSGMTEYGNATFYICPTNDGKATKFSIEAYQVYGKGKKAFEKTEVGLSKVQVGDFVVLRGKFTNYSNQVYETEGRGNAYIYYSNNPNF